jgi:RNA polymerase sigma factor (TIGR02999 family)
LFFYVRFVLVSKNESGEISVTERSEIWQAIERGDPVDTAQLLPFVYDELKKIAVWRMSQEKAGFTLQATALVHEAYLRLQGNSQEPVCWKNRAHFFGAAAEAMRRILVDAARRRLTEKRGGQAARSDLDGCSISTSVDETELIAVHELIDKLAALDPQAAQLVKLRFFVELSMQEIADVLGVSVRKAHDIWAYARAWLRKECS